MQQQTPSAEHPTGQLVNILLVDDQPANLLALEAVLADLGHNLVKASSGEDALRRLLTHDFAVILLDVQMHGMDGFETARLIRDREKSRHTPIIFLTAFESNRLSVQEAYSLGAVDYLVKPLIPVILRAKVTGFVELFEKAEQIKRQAEQIRQMERREFEEALAQENARLRESEQRFARFMQYLPGLAWIKDLQGRYVYANDAALKTFRAPQAIHGKTDDELFTPQTAALFKQNDERAIASGTGLQVIETLEHADGIVHHSIVTKFPIVGSDGTLALVGGMAIDISERLQAEEALRQSEARYRAIFDGSLDSIVMTDDEGRYVEANPSACDLFGQSREQLLGRRIADFAEPAFAFDRAWHAFLKAGHSKGEFRLARPDGATRDVEFAASANILPGRHLSILRDITERKRLERELQQRASELAEADRRKDEFLAMLAHELRNPLAPVRNALQIMKMPGVSSETARQARDMMERQIQHLVRLVDDLLDVSRIMRNRIELRKERVDLATVFARAVETAQPALDAMSHQFSVALAAQPILVEGDAVRLAQVVSNLLVNAAKYTDRAGRVTLIAQREGDEAVIRVQDTGVGIDRALLPSIFDLFTQADRSLARSQGGLGIGLTVVKRLVEMHGGSVSAMSAGPGQGSEFMVRLPALAPDPVDMEATPSNDEVGQAGAPRRILVVDDNVDAAMSTALLLRLLGHHVETVYDGPSTLEAVQAFHPEVILLDLGLPGMSGFDVARTLRAQPEHRELLLVAVTGYGQEAARRQSDEAGFDRHLVKPVEPSALVKALATRDRPISSCSASGL